MVVWGGATGSGLLDSGGRYSPATDSWTPTNQGENVPKARYQHTAVWTGKEMVVWGGEYFDQVSCPLNSGGRYSPGTDSWIPTAQDESVPSVRSGHTAVWTGKEMVIWGGQNQGESLDSGGRYVPETDSWSPTSRGEQVPPPRTGHTAVWTGREMVIWGGSGKADTLASGGRYAPATDSWEPTSQGKKVPLARTNHTAVWTGTEMVVWGGISTFGLYENSGGRYSPSTDSWQPTSHGPNLPVARVGHTAVWTGKEMVVWGGYYFDNDDRTYHFLNSGGRYNPEADSWLPTSLGSNVPTGRAYHTVVYSGNEMVVWGGFSVIDESGHIKDSGGLYCSP